MSPLLRILLPLRHVRPVLFALALGVVLSACKTTNQSKVTAVPRFVLEASVGSTNASMVTMPVSGARIAVDSEAVLSEFDILAVQVAEVEFGKCLLFTLSSQAARDFYRTTTLNQGKRLVLLVNGRAIGVRILDQPIANGALVTYLEVPDDSLEELAEDMKGTIVEIRKRLD